MTNANRAIAALSDATRRAIHLREEFLRIASHELRTPLASLRMSAESLLRAAEKKRAVSPEIMDRTLRRVLGNTARLEQLTSELLDATRIEETTAALAHAAGFLRSELAHRMKLRVVPQLSFKYDASVERGARVSQLIDAAVAEDAKRGRRRK